jgi:hypothetical protein
MIESKRTASRREFLRQALAATAVAGTAAWGQRAVAAPAQRIKVAAVMTEFTHRSHAHVILENFLEPYLFNGQKIDPGMDVVSFYVDQFPATEMAREISKQYNIPIFPTISEALCLGKKKLAVDAVLSIGEHGNYPHNVKGQHEYPRKRFFDEIAAVCELSDRGVPVFSDKHLSYRWDWAREMYDTAKRLNIPLMAGSSVPLAQRRPPLELPPEAVITSAISIHGGGVESYDFHALEVLQSMIEARRGGETGVASVRFVSGNDLWKAADDGDWSVPLAEAALAAELGPGLPPLRELCESGKLGGSPPHAILLTYSTGLKAAAVKIGDSSTRWDFACNLEGSDQPVATSFYVGPWQNRNLFKALSHAIQAHFREGRAPYPVERTLLVTGILDASMESRYQSKPMDTPQLGISYQPRDFRAMREMGDSWKIITEEMPEPTGIQPIGV